VIIFWLVAIIIIIIIKIVIIMYKIYDVIQNILLLWTTIAFVRIFIFIFYVFKKLFYFAINFVT